MSLAPLTRDFCPRGKKRNNRHHLIYRGGHYQCVCGYSVIISQQWAGVTVTTAAATYRLKPLTLKEKAEKAEQERWLNMKGVLG